MHEYLATRPVDLYGIHVFELVARLGGFTRAAEAAGLSQSAVTRQIQGIEARLGAPLFERTTRKIELTPAGRTLLAAAKQLTGALDTALQRFREEHLDHAKTVRIGFSRSIGLASLPGFLIPFRRKSPEVKLQVSHGSSAEISASLLTHEIDIAVVTAPQRLNFAFEVKHRFLDEFELVASAETPLPTTPLPCSPSRLRSWSEQQQWILLDEKSNSGKLLHQWLKKHRWTIKPAMVLDTFEVIIHLVALGVGVSLVPRRALAAYPRKKLLVRMPLKQRCKRDIVMLTRKGVTLPDHISKLIEGVLFS